MTYNEFKFCCLMFTKAFEGKKYGEIVDDAYLYDHDCIISSKTIIFTFSLKRFGYNSKPALFVYFRHSLTIYKDYEHGAPNQYFKTVEDFLNHFEISFEDIV